VFIGGGNYARGEIELIDQKLFELTQPKSMTVVPFATTLPRRKEHFDVISTNYRKFGLRQITLVEESLNTSAAVEMLNGVDAIYLTGGWPEKLIDMIQRKNMTGPIHNHPGTIIGISAGALALCKECLITKDEDYPETMIVDGLGLVDFSVEVHYDPADPEREAELVTLSLGRTIYALPDGSGMITGHKEPILINPIYLFKDGRRERIN
jgi:peptidase E